MSKNVARAAMLIASVLRMRRTKAAGGEAQYRTSIRSAVRGLWAGETSRGEFEGAMTATIERRLSQAWTEGLAACGFTPEEATPADREVRTQAIDENIGYIVGFADAIEAGSRANGGKLDTLYSRAEMWVTGYGRTKTQTQLVACADQKFRWRWNPNKEHCDDCRNLNGRVYRASVWASYGVMPRSRELQCGGWRCGCNLEKTDAPVTPGRPPELRGPG
jgi:hypothetical protein